MDPALENKGIWKAERNAVVAFLSAPGSKARNERGALSVSKLRQIGTRVWPGARPFRLAGPLPAPRGSGTIRTVSEGGLVPTGSGVGLAHASIAVFCSGAVH